MDNFRPLHDADGVVLDADGQEEASRDPIDIIVNQLSEIRATVKSLQGVPKVAREIKQQTVEFGTTLKTLTRTDGPLDAVEGITRQLQALDFERTVSEMQESTRLLLRAGERYARTSRRPAAIPSRKTAFYLAGFTALGILILSLIHYFIVPMNQWLPGAEIYVDYTGTLSRCRQYVKITGTSYPCTIKVLPR